MTDKLDAATIRELLAKMGNDDSLDPRKFLELARYALELSEKVEVLQEQLQAKHSPTRIQQLLIAKEEQLQQSLAETKSLDAQLQSQAAELERLTEQRDMLARTLETRAEREREMLEGVAQSFNHCDGVVHCNTCAAVQGDDLR